MIMNQTIMGVLVIILAIFAYAHSQMSQPQFTIKAETGKAFEETCLIGTFEITNGNIADCLEHCLENCSCQSFQVCGNTQCQLCSSRKEDDSLLLGDKKDCVYATYEMHHLTGSFQKMSGQCSGMGCLLKHNCCQQSGVCHKNRICKPTTSLEVNHYKKPWKRYICDCPDGYHGGNCNKRIKSCRGYANGFRKSGTYKIFDDSEEPKNMYEVYCHFDSDGAWTLVQSYSYANYKTSNDFKKSISEDKAIDKNAPTWISYRLRKKRMESIEKDSNLVRLTCNYEKHHNVKKSDYVEIRIRKQDDTGGNERIINLFEDNLYRSTPGHGRIGEIRFDDCKILFRQNKGGRDGKDLHINIYPGSCNFELPTVPTSCNGDNIDYFGNYEGGCLDTKHRCVNDNSSTTQLWFGNILPKRVRGGWVAP